jgi:hypothetical protein
MNPEPGTPSTRYSGTPAPRNDRPFTPTPAQQLGLVILLTIVMAIALLRVW